MFAQEMLEMLESAKEELDSQGEEQLKLLIDKVPRVEHKLINKW